MENLSDDVVYVIGTGPVKLRLTLGEMRDRMSCSNETRRELYMEALQGFDPRSHPFVDPESVRYAAGEAVRFYWKMALDPDASPEMRQTYRTQAEMIELFHGMRKDGSPRVAGT